MSKLKSAIDISKELGIYEESELKPELIGAMSINPWLPGISGGRMQMFSSHIGQVPEVKGHTPAGCMSGVEYEYAKYTHRIVAEHDMHVLKVINGYREDNTFDSVKNTSTIIIYEADFPKADGSTETEIDYLEIPAYHMGNTRFGMQYVMKTKIREYIPKGTVLAEAKTVTEDTGWEYGIEATTALMTIEEVIEDGYRITESFCEKMSIDQYQVFDIQFGKNKFPLNVYGDEKNYKVFPDIGTKIRDDGVIMALRKHPSAGTVMGMSAKACSMVNHMFDTVYRCGAENAEVVDVQVYHDYTLDGNVRAKRSNIPEEISSQPNRYLTNRRIGYSEIAKFYKQMVGDRDQSRLNLRPKFNNLVRDALVHLAGSPSQPSWLRGDYSKHVRMWRNKYIDDWFVRIVVKSSYTGKHGSKLTGRHGNKGVVVNKVLDSHNNNIDVIADPLSIVKRSNLTVCHEIYINSSSLMLAGELTKSLQANPSDDNYKHWGSKLHRYLSIVTPTMADLILDTETGLVSKGVIDSVMEQYLSGFPAGFTKFIPVDNPVDYIKVVATLEKEFPPYRDYVTYTNQNGVEETTKDKMVIGSMYILPLEKLGNTQSGVGISRQSPFGTATKTSGSEKDTTIIPVKPLRFGEAELKHLTSYMGCKHVGELVKTTNSPAVIRNQLENIFKNPKSLRPKTLVDPRVMEKAKSRIVDIVDSIDNVAGRKMVRGVDENR